MAHPAVHKAAEPGHLSGVKHAIADDQRGGLLFRALEEKRNIIRRMLAIAIEGEGPVEPELARVLPTRLQSGAFSSAAFVPQDFGASFFREIGRCILRAIIHYDHCGQAQPNRSHERPNGRLLVQTGNDRGTC